MAKTKDSNNAVKKLQKEVAALRNKLKAAEKKHADSEKSWKKKHQTFQSESEKKLRSAHETGFKAGQSESEKKAAARKKALHTAELAFEKDYKSKGPKKAKAGKKGKGTKAKSKSARASSTKTKVSKAAKPARKSKGMKKTSAKGSSMKRRGRPKKQEAHTSSHEGMMGHHTAHHTGSEMG